MGSPTCARLGRHAFRIAATAAAVCFLFLSLRGARASGAQSAVPRALDATDAIPYFIAEGNTQAGYRASDRELARWALEAWQRNGANRFRFEPAASESRALVRVYWTESGGGYYGETRPLAVGGRRGAAVFIQPDVEAQGPEMAKRAREDPLLRDSIVYLTCLHELGHALGLEHTQDFRDIMYFFGYGGDVSEYFGRYRAQVRSRSDIAKVSGLSEGDLSRLRELYGAGK